MTYLCVPIFVTDFDKARRDIATAIEAGAEMIELRIDDQTDAAVVGSLLKSRVVCPIIVTCRPVWEGGRSNLDDPHRAELLNAVAQWADYVDLELKAVRAGNGIVTDLAGKAHCHVILSSHDFTGRPDRLYNIITEMDGIDVGVNKIAWTAQHPRQPRGLRNPAKP